MKGQLYVPAALPLRKRHPAPTKRKSGRGSYHVRTGRDMSVSTSWNRTLIHGRSNINAVSKQTELPRLTAH
jgi:hypothetical protein